MNALAYVAEHLGVLLAVAVVVLVCACAIVLYVHTAFRCTTCTHYGVPKRHVEGSPVWSGKKGWQIQEVVTYTCPHCRHEEQAYYTRPATAAEIASFG